VLLAPKLAGGYTTKLPRNVNMAEPRGTNLKECGRRERLVLATASSRGSSRCPPPVRALRFLRRRGGKVVIFSKLGNKVVNVPISLLRSPKPAVSMTIWSPALVWLFSWRTADSRRRPGTGVWASAGVVSPLTGPRPCHGRRSRSGGSCRTHTGSQCHGTID
jgi:hypothetical protein